tara:strand:+ start:965 stop:1435 length:471 start_codon:yes stop_codon:yes gene_type:complete
MLGPTECYRRVGPVDIGPVLRMLDRLTFNHLNAGHATKYPQDVVVWHSFPAELRDYSENLGLGGTLARAILRKLPAGGRITPHVDEWMPNEVDWRRFQVPIISHPDVQMRWPDDDIEVFLEPGSIYEVRYDRTHEVTNASPIDRIHLQIDQVDATV